MTAEDNSIFDEINEELKHDEFLSFLKRNSKPVTIIIGIVVVGIVFYSWWNSQKKQRLELITTNLYQELYTSGKKSDAAIENLEKNAPAEIVPLISIIKSGRKLVSAIDVQKPADYLLKLSQTNGLDIVWKDLALLIYCSYKLESNEDLLKKLEILSSEGRPFRYSALERTALIYENMGQHDKAIENLSKIIDSAEAPISMKKRMQKIKNYLINKETL